MGPPHNRYNCIGQCHRHGCSSHHSGPCRLLRYCSMVSVFYRPTQALGRRRRHAQPHTVVHLPHGLCWRTHHHPHALCLAYHSDDRQLLPPPQRRPAESYPRCHHLRHKHRGHLRISGPHRHLRIECQHLERFEHKRCVQHLPIPLARGLCGQFLGRLRNHVALQLEQ